MLNLNYSYYSGDDVFPALLKRNFINPLSVVMRRAVFQKTGYFNESLRSSEDLDFWVRAAYAGIRFDFMPDALAHYRIWKESLSYSTGSVRQKKTALEIFIRLSERMSPSERARYGMFRVRMRHRTHLWYAQCVAYFPVLGAIKLYFQKPRFSVYREGQ